MFPRWDVIAIIFSVFLLTYTYIEARANVRNPLSTLIVVLADLVVCVLVLSWQYPLLEVSTSFTDAYAALTFSCYFYSYLVLIGGFAFAPSSPHAVPTTPVGFAGEPVHYSLSTIEMAKAMFFTLFSR